MVIRIGDETVGELWPLYDGQDVLNEVDPQFRDNIKNRIERAVLLDSSYVSANTDPKGDRSKRPEDQDEDWSAEDRFKLLAFARDRVNSGYAGHRVTFELFAHSPAFAHLNAVFMNFYWNQPVRLVHMAAGLSDRVKPVPGQ